MIGKLSGTKVADTSLAFSLALVALRAADRQTLRNRSQALGMPSCGAERDELCDVPALLIQRWPETNLPVAAELGGWRIFRWAELPCLTK